MSAAIFFYNGQNVLANVDCINLILYSITNKHWGNPVPLNVSFLKADPSPCKKIKIINAANSNGGEFLSFVWKF